MCNYKINQHAITAHNVRKNSIVRRKNNMSSPFLKYVVSTTEGTKISLL